MDREEILIAGEVHPASDGTTYDRMSPLTGEVASTAAAASEEDARLAADAAAAAFPGWSDKSPLDRRRALFAAADALVASEAEIVDAMASEIGATNGWARFNIALGADMLREAGALTTFIKGEVIPANRLGTTALAIRQPVGVVLAMAPWNAPIVLGVRSVAAALACGNTAVLKSSEICPRTHRLMVDAICGSGLPPGVLNLVSTAPADAGRVVEALIAHPAVRRVNFTGSTRVGRIIGEVAGRYLKPALLELGGKAPLLVLDDADIDAAVAATVFGAYMNQGQICMSTERLLVHRDVADAYADKLAERVRELKVDDPRKNGTALGCVVDPTAAERIEALIRDAVDNGASLLAGGGRSGTLMEATLLDHVGPAMRIYAEESFGPVASIIRVGSEDEAIRIANDTEYGLSAAVFSRDINRALAVAKRIESGICHINGPTLYDEPQMPFGGVKASGYGKFGGNAGIEQFTELRWITIQDGLPHYPI